MQAKQQLRVSRVSPNFNTLRTELPSALGSTEEGRKFYYRQLHPNDETLHGGCKIPDEWAGDSVAAEMRYDAQITAPAVAGKDKYTWDCLILSPPTPDIPIMYLVRESGTTWSHKDNDMQVPWYPNVPYGSQSYVPGPGSGSAQEYGTWSLKDTNNLGVLAQQQRSVYKGISVHLVANSLIDQGMSYSCQYSDAGKVSTLMDATMGAISGVYQQNPTLRIFDRVPNEKDQLFNKSAATVAQEAREGVYMSHRFAAPTHLFQSNNQLGEVVQANLVFANGFSKNFVLGNFDTNAGMPAEGVQRWIFQPSGDLNFGVIYFQGLDSQASLDIKVRFGAEAIPATNSAWTSFSGSSPLLDRTALDGVRVVGAKLSQAYPVRYNDLGLLGKILSKVANFVLPKVVPVVGDLLAGVVDKMTGINNV